MAVESQLIQKLLIFCFESFNTLIFYFETFEEF